MVKLNSKKRYQKGYIALTTVLLVGAVATSITTALLIMGISYSKTTTAVTNGMKSRSYAEACVEDALREINQNITYVTPSNVVLSFSGDSCNYSVSGTPPIKTINATGVSGNSTKRIKVTTSQVSPKIIVDFWQEVASF